MGKSGGGSRRPSASVRERATSGGQRSKVAGSATAHGAHLTATSEGQRRAVEHAREGARYWQNLADRETQYPQLKLANLQRATADEEAAKRYEAGNFRPPAMTHGRANETPETHLGRLNGELYAREAWSMYAHLALDYQNLKAWKDANAARKIALRTEIGKVEPLVRDRAPKQEYARLAKSKPYESQKYHGPAPVMQHGVRTTINLKQPENASPKQMREYERLSRDVARIQSTLNQSRTPQQQREDTARNTLRVRTLAGKLHDAEIDHQHSVFAVRAEEPGTKAYDAARTRAKTLYARSESLRAQMNQAIQEEVARQTPQTAPKTAPRRASTVRAKAKASA